MLSNPARRRLLATTILFGSSFATLPAFAQGAPAGDTAIQSSASGNATVIASAAPDQNSPAADQTIVVTGSRIARPELEAPSPVAVVSSAQIQSQGITNVQDLVAKLPQAGIPGFSRTNTNFATTGNGISSINLRNLGSARTP